MNRYISLLRRNRDFRALWSASVITMLGDWFNTIGTVVLVSRYTDSGAGRGRALSGPDAAPLCLQPACRVGGRPL